VALGHCRDSQLYVRHMALSALPDRYTIGVSEFGSFVLRRSKIRFKEVDA
jgi:hypothetical protein